MGKCRQNAYIYRHLAYAVPFDMRCQLGRPQIVS